jgi:peptidyl-dipeptidase Dcp
LSYSQENVKLNEPNPFFMEWDGPFNTPPFDQFKPEHYKPAFIEAMKVHKKEISAIINSKEAPTFKNTLEAMEKSGEFLQRVSNVFDHMEGTQNSPEIQKISEEISPLISAHYDDISLDEKLFARVKSVYNQREHLNPEEKRLVEKYYTDFIRGGAGLKDKDKEEFRKINEELSLLSLKFSQNVLAETNSFELIVDDPAELKGLPESALTAAKEAAKKKGYENKYLFTLHAPSYRPIIQYVDNRNIREKMFRAYLNRGNNNNEYDNKDVISKIVSLRLKRAKLLGYDSHANYVMSQYMAQKPERVYDFLNKLQEPANKLAVQEAKQLQEMIDKEGGNFKLQPWDWTYYSEKLKKEKYSLDEEELRPYFKLENVLDGVFAVTGKLYGIKFQERNDIASYHPDVKIFEVMEEDGRHIGIIYFDYFPRESKRAGAWMMPFRQQNKLGGKNVTPLVMNCGNLNKPTADKPSLLTLDEVQTIFHEFGHALHGLFSDVTYPRFAGTNVAWDFVELPSQIMENWSVHPEVLRDVCKAL